MSKLKEQLLNANLGLTEKDFGFYATDLYVVAKFGVGNWIKKNYPLWKNVTTFIGQKNAD
jgi:hypothetical protein